MAIELLSVALTVHTTTECELSDCLNKSISLILVQLERVILSVLVALITRWVFLDPQYRLTEKIFCRCVFIVKCLLKLRESVFERLGRYLGTIWHGKRLLWHIIIANKRGFFHLFLLVEKSDGFVHWGWWCQEEGRRLSAVSWHTGMFAFWVFFVCQSYTFLFWVELFVKVDFSPFWNVVDNTWRLESILLLSSFDCLVFLIKNCNSGLWW